MLCHVSPITSHCDIDDSNDGSDDNVDYGDERVDIDCRSIKFFMPLTRPPTSLLHFCYL